MSSEDSPDNKSISQNLTGIDCLPIDMRFNEGHIVSIVTYSILLLVSSVGNLTVLRNLCGKRKLTSPRVNLMLTHLAIADLMVTLLMMPLEIGWAATVQWKAGDVACRIMAFFRTFGLFLSSFVLICISIDRYCAIMQPLNLKSWQRRGRLMLVTAWCASAICSFPQTLVFHVESHPNYTWYEQCVTFHSFPSPTQEILYAAFGMVMMYAIPLLVIIFTYGSILCEIARRISDHDPGDVERNGIRRLTVGYFGRAKIKTVKMTVAIVGVFVFCWTPYNVMSIWYWCDRDSALQVDQRIQRGLFLFACTNSCVNPIVYGIFSRRTPRRQSQHPNIPFRCPQSARIFRRAQCTEHQETTCDFRHNPAGSLVNNCIATNQIHSSSDQNSDPIHNL